MPTSTTVKGLNINELTEAQYDAAVQGGVIGPNELSVLTDVSYVEPSDLATVATTGDYDDLINKPTIPAAIQVSSMPIAGVDELDKIYQFVGTTDANYTNGYFYKCVSDGQTPATYSWEQTDVMPAGSSLPSQTGHSGEFLTTDGTDASWAAVNALQNTATGTDGLTILGTASTVNYSINIGVNSKVSQTSGVAIGRGAEARAYQSSKLGTAIGTNAFVEGEAGVAIGSNSCSYANASGYAVSIGGFAIAYDYGIAIGTRTQVFNTAPGAIQLGNCWTNNTSPTQNMDAHTFKVGLRTGTNYELLSSDGTIPEARLADTTNAQQGDVLTLDSNGDAVWQAGGGGSSYTAGTGIDITNDVISVKPEVVINNNTTYPRYNIAIADSATASSNGVAVGYSAQTAGGASVGQFCRSTNGFAGGSNCVSTVSGGVALGKFCGVTAANAIQIGSFTQLTNNSDANTLKVGNANGNFEIMSADGTIPEARLADTTNATQGQVLTLDSNGDAVWQTPSTAVTSTTATLAVADWSSNTQTLTVSGVTSSNVVIVSPQPLSSGDYATAGVLCTAQNTNSLTFTCTQTPSNAIDLSIVIIG